MQKIKNLIREAKSLIKQLLIADASKRLGVSSLKGAEDIYNVYNIYHHKWFRKFEWNELRNMRMRAEYIPKIR